MEENGAMDYSRPYLRPLKKFEYAKEAAQIFVFGARVVLNRHGPK
jgi:hypothetical protein